MKKNISGKVENIKVWTVNEFEADVVEYVASIFCTKYDIGCKNKVFIENTSDEAVEKMMEVYESIVSEIINIREAAGKMTSYEYFAVAEEAIRNVTAGVNRNELVEHDEVFYNIGKSIADYIEK